MIMKAKKICRKKGKKERKRRSRTLHTGNVECWQKSCFTNERNVRQPICFFGMFAFICNFFWSQFYQLIDCFEMAVLSSVFLLFLIIIIIFITILFFFFFFFLDSFILSLPCFFLRFTSVSNKILNSHENCQN